MSLPVRCFCCGSIIGKYEQKFITKLEESSEKYFRDKEEYELLIKEDKKFQEKAHTESELIAKHELFKKEREELVEIAKKSGIKNPYRKDKFTLVSELTGLPLSENRSELSKKKNMIVGDILNSFNLKKYCCRRMFLGYVNTLDELLKFPKDIPTRNTE
jgi:DNA-directed RNA polymerase subunit N (RpoN/RPB10)